MTSLTEYAVQTEWIETTMPILISFAVAPGASDDWLRHQIRGESAPLPRLQQVIVQGTNEADRLTTALANLKHRRGLAYGGSSQQRYHRP